MQRTPLRTLPFGLLLWVAACGPAVSETGVDPSEELLGTQESALCSGLSVTSVTLDGFDIYEGVGGGSGRWTVSTGANAARVEYHLNNSLLASEERKAEPDTSPASGPWYFSHAPLSCGVTYTLTVKVYPMVIDSAGNRTTCFSSFTSVNQSAAEPCPSQSGYWAPVAKTLPRTPTGHVVGIGRHNSYVDTETSSSLNLSKTNARIQLAIDADADMIELDIKDEGGLVSVTHADSGQATGALLANVLDYAPLRSDDSVLYIEIKEQSSHSSVARQLLDMLQARRSSYARQGRPVVIRSFHSLQANLTAVQSLLAEYPNIQPYIRLQVLFSDNQTSNMVDYHGLIRGAATQGWHGIELPYTDQNLLSKIAYAKSLGLGVSVWTVPASFGEIFLSNLREEVDALIVEYDVAKARTVVSDANQLLYMNVWNQPHGATSLLYHRSGATTYPMPVNVAGAPATITDAAGEDRYGTSLLFSAPSAQSLSFYDADTAAGQGYLVSAYVNFDDLLTSCPGGASSCTMALLNKSEVGAFALELNRSSTGARVLRFGVHVGGAYQLATMSLDSLNGTQGYLVTGTYDGNGHVRLWVDNGAKGSVGPFTGGVLNTNVPMTAGADPQASGGPRFFLSGKIQMLQVLRWAPHP